jgi:hypothetical protein
MFAKLVKELKLSQEHLLRNVGLVVAKVFKQLNKDHFQYNSCVGTVMVLEQLFVRLV